MAAEGKTEREEGLEFALQLMGASSEGLAKTTNTLLDNLTAQRDELQAEVNAIRDTIQRMYEQPFMPNPEYVIRALWPSADTINHYRKGRDY